MVNLKNVNDYDEWGWGDGNSGKSNTPLKSISNTPPVSPGKKSKNEQAATAHQNENRKSAQDLLNNYANNIRKLIITARYKIDDLTKEVDELKRQLKSSGVVKCPSCSSTFKERNHRQIPKYIKIFRGKFTIELEFANNDLLAEWLTLNGLDKMADGLPTLLPTTEREEPSLDNTGSQIKALLAQKIEKKDIPKVLPVVQKAPQVVNEELVTRSKAKEPQTSGIREKRKQSPESARNHRYSPERKRSRNHSNERSSSRNSQLPSVDRNTREKRSRSPRNLRTRLREKRDQVTSRESKTRDSRSSSRAILSASDQQASRTTLKEKREQISSNETKTRDSRSGSRTIPPKNNNQADKTTERKKRDQITSSESKTRDSRSSSRAISSANGEYASRTTGKEKRDSKASLQEMKQCSSISDSRKTRASERKKEEKVVDVPRKEVKDTRPYRECRRSATSSKDRKSLESSKIGVDAFKDSYKVKRTSKVTPIVEENSKTNRSQQNLDGHSEKPEDQPSSCRRSSRTLSSTTTPKEKVVLESETLAADSHSNDCEDLMEEGEIDDDCHESIDKPALSKSSPKSLTIRSDSEPFRKEITTNSSKDICSQTKSECLVQNQEANTTQFSKAEVPRTIASYSELNELAFCTLDEDSCSGLNKSSDKIIKQLTVDEGKTNSPIHTIFQQPVFNEPLVQAMKFPDFKYSHVAESPGLRISNFDSPDYNGGLTPSEREKFDAASRTPSDSYSVVGHNNFSASATCSSEISVSEAQQIAYKRSASFKNVFEFPSTRSDSLQSSPGSGNEMDSVHHRIVPIPCLQSTVEESQRKIDVVKHQNDLLGTDTVTEDVISSDVQENDSNPLGVGQIHNEREEGESEDEDEDEDDDDDGDDDGDEDVDPDAERSSKDENQIEDSCKIVSPPDEYDNQSDSDGMEFGQVVSCEEDILSDDADIISDEDDDEDEGANEAVNAYTDVDDDHVYDFSEDDGSNLDESYD